MEPLAEQARELHRETLAAGALAQQKRDQRDTCIRALRARDPGRWTHRAIARYVGVSEELIALVLRQERARQ